MAKQRMTLEAITAHQADVDFAKIDATTEDDIRRHMREEGYDYDEEIREEDIISPAVIRKRLGMSQRQFAGTIHVPLATLQNWEQGRTLMDPSARALMTILAREPDAALRALRPGVAVAMAARLTPEERVARARRVRGLTPPV
jgi:putative transcriptional regulator